MWIVILILSVTSCHAATEFSSRPTNVSLLLTHFTYKELNRPTFLGTFGVWSLMAGLSFGAHGDTYKQIFRGCLLLTDMKKFNTQYKNLTEILFDGDLTGVRVSNKNYFLLDLDANTLVLRDFKSMLVNYYDTRVYTLDFQDRNTASIINEKIKEFSPPVTNIFNANDFKETAIIMCNVLFFQGNWSFPFNSSNTRKEELSTSQGDIGSVNMMYLQAKVPYSHIEAMKASAMELPFGNDGKYCMLLLFPDPNVSTIEVFRNFEKLTFREIFAKLQSDVEESGLKEVEVKLPRFVKISNLQLQKPLNDMGIYDAFDPTYARFGKMSREPIYIETIEHNAVIIVTETGTVAYATTPGFNSGSSSLRETNILPPLILFIMEKSTATVLFSGIF
ncbi:serine protease inhibitor 77Ba-like [Melitaea cinxia]|uniref:serine protease inhibitor 77Ba-like n=1 Tax=Melitaea cinxia TaxID=113334 RepID=UPI001E2740CF|nr:serine protease inhibitor 77Ba-like [Melitaea cinxia]